MASFSHSSISQCEAGTNSVAGSTICTTPTTGLPAWLVASAAGRFDADACNETRTWKEILSQGADSFMSGGLGSRMEGPWEVWVCWPGHPCLATVVGAASGDSACYAYQTHNATWHAFGLNSELGLCSKVGK